MSPTFWGTRTEISCESCGIEWTTNWQPEYRPLNDFRCWNCGGINPAPRSSALAGQSIEIDADAYHRAAPALNDVVAISDRHGVRIKRIVGVPGQLISLRQGLIHRDEKQMESSAPWLVVHDDAYRSNDQSWWAVGDSIWKPTANGFMISITQDQHATSAAQGTLRYAHRAPYQDLKPDVVRDDYACNLNEARKLWPVDRLQITAKIKVSQDASLELWTWSALGNKRESLILSPGDHVISERWETSSAVENAPLGLDASHPLAVVVVRGSLELMDIVVKRPVLYHTDSRSKDLTQLPIMLQENQYFVIGDNVPLSIDSRHIGAINRSSIIGRVIEH